MVKHFTVVRHYNAMQVADYLNSKTNTLSSSSLLECTCVVGRACFAVMLCGPSPSRVVCRAL